MRHPPCSPVRLGIIAFDQCHLIGPLPVQIVPLVLLVRSDRKRFPDSIRVDELHGQKVAVRDRIGVGDAQRIFEDGLDGPPDVDDLMSAFEQLVGFLREVVYYALRSCFIGLINMHALDRAAGGLCSGAVFAFVVGLTADCVVEDEDLGGTGAVHPVRIKFRTHKTRCFGRISEL